MFRIIGLQNKGQQYQETPHNIGGEILEKIWKNNPDFFSDLYFSKSRNADISEGLIEKNELELLFPHTFMNLSGNVLPRDIKEKDIEKIIVLHDDIDLPFGKVKIVFGRGDGGHNGLKSIIKKTNSKDFIRIKIGVCPLNFFGKCKKPSKEYLNKYLVDKSLPFKYTKQYLKISEDVKEIITEIIKTDYKKAMNKYN